MPVIGSQSLGRNNVAERDYLKSMGDVVRLATNSTRTYVGGPGVGFIETLGGADGDNVAYFLYQKVDLTAAGPRGRMRVKVKLTEAATDNLDFAAGLSSGWATADTGVFSATAGQLTSGDHILALKAAESLFFRYIGAANATHTAAVLTTTPFASATTYLVEVRWQCGAEGIDAQFLVDDVEIGSVSKVAYTNMASVYVGFGFKATNTNAEIMQVEEFLAGNVDA